jgi:ankyrin repeat protein
MVVLDMLSLLGKGADPNLCYATVGANGATRVKMAPLWCASINGHSGVVQALLKAGADADCTTGTGVNVGKTITALMFSSYSGHLNVVNELIRGGADLENIDTLNGETALFYAVTGGHIGVVKVLLEAGANRAKVANDGTTPLMAASLMLQIGGGVDMVNLLE